jgi:hypothetical protein
MSDNISVEGVERDLEAMKSAGIGRAFIGNIGGEGVPYGKVKILSDEWWTVLHAAMKKAGELGIEIGMFNSPGWSQSGGPWIKPQQSMRRLASTSTQIDGGSKVSLKLDKVGDNAQDIRVVAYPALPENEIAEKTISVKKENDKPLTVDFRFDKPATARSIIIETKARIWSDADIFVKDGADYRHLKRVNIRRTNSNLNVGFMQHAPVVASLPETKATNFRVVLVANGAGDIDITLSSRACMERYPEKTLGKMFQEPIPMWHDYLWDEQAEANPAVCIPVDKVIDLTDKMSADGTLQWDAPEGLWTVKRIAMITTGVQNAPAAQEGKGLETDKLNKEHIYAHFDAFIGEVLRRIPAKDRRTFKVVVADSYETGGQNWTDNMLEQFEKTYFYSAVPYLPVFDGEVVGSRELSDRFLWDVRRLVADRVSYEYVGGLREISNKHGLTTWLENYGHWGFPGEFLQYGGQSDEIGGEFWAGNWGDGIENHAASSCAHIYGKRRAWAESCTSGGPHFWLHPGNLKSVVDRSFTDGINASLLHVYIQQAYEDWNPGINAWFGVEFNRKNTWFSQMQTFTNYLRRCNFLLQQGLYVADVAYFIGEDAPKMTGVCTPELPQGYSYDFINAEVLLTRASVEDGKLTLPDGMQYSVLVLPPLETMRPDVLMRITELVKEGLTVVGRRPQRSPSLENYPSADDCVQCQANEMWGPGDQKLYVYGKGKVFAGDTPLKEVFASLKLPPDFDLKSTPNDKVKFTHRKLNDGDIYFVSNQSDQKVHITPEFRVSGRAVEFWHPVTMEMGIENYFRVSDKATIALITLEPFESVFVIFRDKFDENGHSKMEYTKYKTLQTINSPWTVKFEEGKGGPKEPVTFNSLSDWAQSDDENIRYFSGTAHYETKFTVDKIPDSTAYIEFSKVMVMATVKLNGKPLGALWASPYRVPLGNALKKGENVLEVDVVNNWANRMIGDSRLPEDKRTTRASTNPYKPDSQLQESGLIGTCSIITK